MKKKLLKWMCKKDWIYRLCMSLIANRIVYSNNKLTPEYLTTKKWIYENGFYVEPNVKLRDKIWVQFEHHYFRVWHGEDRTFIALESSLEWFDNYYLLAHGDNGRYQLAGL